MAVNKKEFAYRLAEKGNFYKKYAVKAVDLFWDTLVEYLEEGNTVNFYGYGSFKMKTYREGEARNPKTGESCIVPERKKIKFCPSRILTVNVEHE